MKIAKRTIVGLLVILLSTVFVFAPVASALEVKTYSAILKQVAVDSAKGAALGGPAGAAYGALQSATREFLTLSFAGSTEVSRLHRDQVVMTVSMHRKQVDYAISLAQADKRAGRTRTAAELRKLEQDRLETINGTIAVFQSFLNDRRSYLLPIARLHTHRAIGVLTRLRNETPGLATIYQHYRR